MAFDQSYVQADKLTSLFGIKHAFFTRKNGVSSGIYAGRNVGLGSDDDRDLVLENRARCAADLGTTPENLATPHQTHSTDVAVVDQVWAPGKGPKADAMVTNRTGIALGISTADCGPVLFADDHAQVIGAAHAGWRGATGGVLENTISTMETLGANRANIVAILGPTIAHASYEVGPEFVERLEALAPENEQFLTPSEREAHALFDLPAYICDRLAKSEIKIAGNLALDTYADEDRFYSYRRTTHRGEADYGRLLSAIILRS